MARSGYQVASSGSVSTTSANVVWGPDFGESSDDNTFTAGVRLTMPSLVLENNKTVGAQLTMPALAMENNKTVGVHLSGTALGAPFFQSVNTAETSTAATSLGVAQPAGTAIGDFLVVGIGHAANENVTPPAGWTEILFTGRTGVLPTGITTFYRVANAAGSATHTFTWTTSTGGFGWLIRLTAVDAITPINVSGGNNASATDPIAPDITTTATNCFMIVACCQSNAVNADYTAPAGYAERSDQNGLTTAGALIVTGESATRVQAATGASGTQTMNSTQLAASDYVAQHIAIAPGILTLAV